MLQAFNYEVLNMFSPLIGAVPNPFCRVDCGSITEFYIYYVDVRNLVYRKGTRPVLAENKFQLL